MILTKTWGVCAIILSTSAIVNAQREVVYTFQSDRSDSIFVTFDRDPVFNESRLEGAFRMVQVSAKPVVVRYPNVPNMARLSLASYGWPGHFMATDWIVEPNDSVNVFVEFESKPRPIIKCTGRGARKYQVAFEASEHATRIKSAEFDIYDKVKNHEQALQEVAFHEQKYTNLLQSNKKRLPRQVVQTWQTDIQAMAATARLHIQSHQWTTQPKARAAIRKELLATPKKVESPIWYVSRALVRYRYERLKWKVLKEHDPEYRFYELESNDKMNLLDLFLEIQKQPQQDQQFLMLYSLINLYTLQHNFGETHPDILKECLQMAERTIQNSDLKERLKQTTLRTRPGVKINDLAIVTEAGDTIRLSNLRGKKVLLDRWIANCTGCLEFKKEMVEQLLPKIEGRTNLVIWSVGSVKDFDYWKKLLPTNSHPAFQSGWLDKQGGRNEWEVYYNISYAPFIMLIDEEGKLISSTVRKMETILKLLGISK